MGCVPDLGCSDSSDEINTSAETVHARDPDAPESEIKHCAISRSVIDRFPLYERALLKFQTDGVRLATSDQIAEELGITAALVRRDLSHLGQLGTVGQGYEIDSLLKAMKAVLGLDRVRDIAIIGIGFLGRAIARHIRHDTNSFRVAAAFDISDEVVGTTVNGVTVQHVRDSARTLKRLGIKIGIVTVPAAETQSAVDTLTKGGVLAILNYSSMISEKPQSVDVIDFDPCLSLSTLSYRLAI